MVVEMLIGGGFVRLLTATAATSVVSTRTVAATTAVPAAAMACASASASNIRFASLSSKSIVGGSVQIHQPFYFFL